MCGICAMIGGEGAVGVRTITSSVNLLAHRGPDARHWTINDGVALGQTRLQVVGTATQGAQPIQDGRYGLIFNGEIHNYVELAKILGVQPVSDTEVLFGLLKRDGAAALRRLHGFWALIFVDHEERTVLLARDRFGQKPLLYTRRQGGWAVASEAVALSVPLVPDQSRVRSFAIGGHYPDAPATFFTSIEQVVPGHYCTLRLGSQESPTSRPYYRLPSLRMTNLPSFEAASETFRTLLNDSLRLRLRADVPIGLTLSAGKDSGTLAALVPDWVRDAFTFDNNASDSEFGEVSEWYSQRFRLNRAQIALDKKCFNERVKKLHRHLDAPIASASLLALDQIYETAKREEIPVVLSGQGADEILGGYHYFSILQPNPVRALYARAATLNGLSDLRATWKDKRLALNITRQLRNTPTKEAPLQAKASAFDAVNDRQRSDLSGAPLRTMLWYEDRIAMAHGIEARYPFLDVDLVDFCVSLPGKYHVHKSSRKRLLAAAFAKTWPAPLRHEKRKRGLPAAERDLLQNHSQWATEGQEVAKRYFQVAAALPQPVGPRSAMALFRLAAIGHWLNGLDTDR